MADLLDHALVPQTWKFQENTSGPDLFSRCLVGLFLVSSSPGHSASMCVPQVKEDLFMGVRTEFGHAGLCVHICSLVFGMGDLRSFDFYQNNNIRIFLVLY